MKPLQFLPILLALCLGITMANAQPGMGGPPRGGGMGGMMAAPGGRGFDAALGKLFGENTSFTANLEMQTKPSSGNAVTVPGKLAYDKGNSRFDIDMTKMTGGQMPPGAAEQMKAMGMGEAATISRPDKKVSYMIYPGLNAYVEMPMPESEAAATPDKFKIEITELGKETLDGHPCIKNKAVVTDDKGATHESTIWNATDLKKFPIKIEQSGAGTGVTMTFKDVKLSKPEASQFDPPAGATKYDNMQTMMMQEMMKRRGGR